MKLIIKIILKIISLAVGLVTFLPYLVVAVIIALLVTLWRLDIDLVDTSDIIYSEISLWMGSMEWIAGSHIKWLN